MSIDLKIQSGPKETHVKNKDKPRKPYFKPCLVELGDLRTLTLGGSPGINDSGSGSVRKAPLGLPQSGILNPGGFPDSFDSPEP